MRKLLSILLIFAFVLSIGAASAATLNVPGNYKTIQGAINAAHNGDTVKVASGTYNENLVISGKKVSLTGSNFPKIYGASFKAMGNGQLYGFAVNKNGVQISEVGGTTIRNCALTNCGISVTTGTSTGNTLLNNKLTNCGISIHDSRDNSVIGNYVEKGKIGFVMGNGATCKTVTKNTFKNCQIGVQMEAKAGDWMTGNIYSGNKYNFKIV
jgi:parallel beta-helix repeat protein